MYQLYDIFHNGEKLVIIRPAESLFDIYVNHQKMFLYKCLHYHTYIYTLKLPYSPRISLTIENKVLEKKVNVYPTFKDEIILSTLVKEEDEFIIPWIQFHLTIGITRFIIYDNSTNETLPTLLKTYLENKQVVLIPWPYSYRLPISGISGQTTQQNHSIYAFPTCKYIGLLDIDEYINLQQHTNIHDFFDDMTQLNDIKQVGSFTIRNKFFYNPDELPTNNGQFLHIFNCDDISEKGHEKNFVIPSNVKTYSVHMITDGKPMVLLNEKYVYLNHYCFLNKSDRGRKKTNQIDTSILKNIN